MLGLRFCVRAFSSCGKRGPLFIAMRGPLTTVASLVAEHRLQTHRLSNCGPRAHLLHGMWDLPRPGPEPVSPALAGRLSTTAPPGKPGPSLFDRVSSLAEGARLLPDVKIKEFISGGASLTCFSLLEPHMPVSCPRRQDRPWNRRVDEASVRSQVGWWVPHDLMCYVLISGAFLISMPVF